MFLELFALFMVLPWALSNNVSTKPGLKIFRDEYKIVTAACLDLGFAKKACKSGSYSDKKVVAFDVRLNGHIRNLGTNGRIVFETVGLNEGKGYDHSTGKFTAPASGMYVFDWTIMTQLGKYAYTAIYVNGDAKSFSHCYDGTSKTYVSCSKMTVVKLNKGDKVWIGVFSGPANMYATYTSFSGYKL
uniref:Complement C1q tumor necrosis factor-related protein 3-like n=1 Tax=Crassostrea virginica TaxID=6565 RepID=A0A8B8C4C8_CRAVI|nr:complement C1q tumor necrosis factor-related protein 3-like [Crassostrea virginica]